MSQHNPVNPAGAPERTTITRWQLNWAGWTMALLAYIVVLNLFEEFVEGVVIESFAISMLVALVLLLVVIATENLEEHVHGYFARRTDTSSRVLGAAAMVTILFVSKFAILEIIDVIFGDAVELGHLVEVVLLVALLIAAQKAMIFVWHRLGSGTTADPDFLGSGS